MIFNLLCFCAVLSCAFSNVLRDAVFPLDLIHYNDFHARFEETTVKLPVCQLNDTDCVGGFARLAYEIKTLLKTKPDAVLLNAGDTFHGTYWYSTMKWNVTQHFLNMLPHDAHTIGNHEFDDGIEGIAPYLAALRAPVVVANIDTTAEPLLNGSYTPHIVIERKGRKIGIIGVSTVDSHHSSRPGKVIFLDPVKVVKEQAQVLTEKGVDIIIVLSHCGLDVDRKIASTAGSLVDIIVGGHTHSLLWNGPAAPSGEPVQGPYPVTVESQSNSGHRVLITSIGENTYIAPRQVLIVQAAAYTKYLGNITVYFDADGDLMSYDATPIFLNRSIPEDPEIKALLQPYKESLHTTVNEVVGYSNDELSYSMCNRKECSLGNLVVDAFLNATKEAYPTNLTQVGLIFASAIKASLPKGVLTRGAVLNVSPFTNKVLSVVIQGRYIMEALQNNMNYRWNKALFILKRLPCVAGMQVALNVTSGAVESVLVRHESGNRPLSLDEDYRVVLLSFIYVSHEFNMFKKHGRDLKIIGNDSDLLEKYVRKVSPLNDVLDERLAVVT